MNIGRMIFYDKITGERIVDTGQWENVKVSKTADQQIETYKELSERNRETFDVIELPFGARQQDFAICNGYRVDPATKEILFSYPDPNNPDTDPVYIPPLSEEVTSLKDENAELIFQNAMQDINIASLQDENAELMLKIATLEASASV